MKFNSFQIACKYITLFFLLVPFSAFTQQIPYYLAGGTTDFDDGMIRQNNPVYITMFGEDSLMILPALNDYKHAAAYKHTKGESFFRRTQSWSSQIPNFVFLFEKGIMIIEETGSYLCFMKDSKLAGQTLSAGGLAQQFRDSLRSVVAAVNDRQRAENGKITEVKYKKIATAYIRGLHSARNDPRLVSDIRKWSDKSIATVTIQDANYTTYRNQFGEVLRKVIRAFIEYRKDGKCYIMWGTFGYQSLGGGQFSKDMTTFVSTYQYISAPGIGEMRLDPGEAQEVDCN